LAVPRIQKHWRWGCSFPSGHQLRILTSSCSFTAIAPVYCPTKQMKPISYWRERKGVTLFQLQRGGKDGQTTTKTTKKQNCCVALGGFDVTYVQPLRKIKTKRASNAELFWRDIHHHLPFLVWFFFTARQVLL
jgi:hypothetical protein